MSATGKSPKPGCGKDGSCPRRWPAPGAGWSSIALPPALSAETHDLRVGEDLALLAWAEAANSSDVQQVDSLLAEAFPLCANATKMVQAQQHYYAGRAYSALQLLGKAAEHFLQARTVDPQGQFGRLAAAMTRTPNPLTQGPTP